jgi:hypothetical protein
MKNARIFAASFAGSSSVPSRSTRLSPPNSVRLRLQPPHPASSPSTSMTK